MQVGDGGWVWHFVEAELRTRGHNVVAPDLPTGDGASTLTEYVDAVVGATGDTAGTGRLIVAGHSLGGFTAPLVAERLQPRS